MSRSSRSSTDRNSLLPTTSRESFSLNNLSPREAPSTRAASPSPPPSFYRSNNTNNERYNDDPRGGSISPSTSRRSGGRRIQFVEPPPPIATSVMLPAKRGKEERLGSSRWGLSTPDQMGRNSSPQIQRRNPGIDPLLGMERRERAIHQELQILLDAQSAGLVQGFGGQPPSGRRSIEEGSEGGSSTPTSLSMQRSSSRSRSRNGDGGVMPVRQPKRKQIGLRGARRGLLRDMGELVAIKLDEVEILATEIERRNEALGQVDVWEKRIEGARKQLTGLTDIHAEGGGEDTMELAELRTEERAVDNEIREMEDRLAQMKARKQWLSDQIQEGVNKQEARLSSYRGALKEAELEVKQFLNRPPVPVSVVMGDEESFMALPSSRRTLGMAREWWNKEVIQLQTRKEEVEKEQVALEEGAESWREIMQTVTEYEDDLRKQMANVDSQSEASMLKAQIDKMNSVIESISQSASEAEEKGWNLLICAIGAELAAFKEGAKILHGALEALVGPEQLHKEQSFHTATSNGLEELNVSRVQDRDKSAEESEDDGPSAELLVESEHDTS